MKIVCLGDSITCDWESPTYVDYWQALCDAKLGPNIVKIINAGINGETSQDGYYRLDNDVIAHQPNMVTVMFGHNEVHGSYQPLDLHHYLDKIVAKLIHHSISNIWLLTPNRIADGVMAKKYEDFLTSIKKVAQERQLPIVDFWSLMEPLNLDDIYTHQFDYAGLTGRDYLHPNEIGHGFMAKILFEKLQQHLT
jgi:lysophospholipase L1-like esterase